MKNQVVVITGSTRGFGYSIAEAMLKAGATVIISGRSVKALEEAINSLSSLGPVAGRSCDVREEKQVYALARQVVEQFGRIDVWINNAGYSASAGWMLETPPVQAIDMFFANDMGSLYGSQAALHFMLARGEGTLVNIYGQGSFLNPATPTGLYGATKAWLTSFTRSLAKEVKGSGVKILAFSPGMMMTEMLASPTVIGERGRQMMKNYAFVLRLLAIPPSRAAERLVSVLGSNRKQFLEYRMLKPWSPFLGLLRVAWENLAKTGVRPDYQVHFEDAYKPEI